MSYVLVGLGGMAFGIAMTFAMLVMAELSTGNRK